MPLFEEEGKVTPCPVSEEVRIWLEESFGWMAEHFGDEVLLNKHPLIADHQDFPFQFKGDLKSAEAALKIVARQMDIDASVVRLHVYQEGIRGTGRTFMQQVEGQRYSGGLYHGSDNDGLFYIGLEVKKLADPEGVIGILAHELSHLKLLGENRIADNNEHLTDLTACIFGFGVINSGIAFRRTTDTQSWIISSSGYLSQMEWGYALALYANLRGEDIPEWVNFLSPNVRADFKQARNFILENPDLFMQTGVPAIPPEHPSVLEARRKREAEKVVTEFDEQREQVFKLYEEKLYEQAADGFYDLFRKGDKERNMLRCGAYALQVNKNYTAAAELTEAYAVNYEMTEEDADRAGHIFLKLKNYEQAQKYFELAVEQNPFSAISLNNLGFAFNRQEKYEEALEHLNDSLEYDPNMAFAWNNRGLAKIKTGSAEDGLKDIQRSLQLKPDNAYSYRNMGIYYLHKKDKPNALNCFETAKQMNAGTDDIDELILSVGK